MASISRVGDLFVVAAVKLQAALRCGSLTRNDEAPFAALCCFGLMRTPAAMLVLLSRGE